MAGFMKSAMSYLGMSDVAEDDDDFPDEAAGTETSFDSDHSVTPLASTPTTSSASAASSREQSNPFHEGDESLLRPMILKDVAERTGLDISTISRVSNSKYVQTNYGIYPLKFFFNDGYTTEDGEEMSVREIRKILKECIDNEDKKKPLTDDELTELLKEKGYPIARRTVAKYRQQMNIPVARLRR